MVIHQSLGAGRLISIGDHEFTIAFEVEEAGTKRFVKNANALEMFE